MSAPLLDLLLLPAARPAATPALTEDSMVGDDALARMMGLPEPLRTAASSSERCDVKLTVLRGATTVWAA